MRGKRFVVLSLALVLGLLMVVAAAGSLSSRPAPALRWDLVSIVQGTVVAGGEDTATDAATGDVVTLTGSGQATPAAADAAGGGTFVHRHANGAAVAHGVYVVIRFISWKPSPGTLPIPDAIGHVEQASSGIVTLRVRFFPDGGSPVEGTLTVNCDLPGATFPITEGVTVAVGPFSFVQSGGATLFHVFS